MADGILLLLPYPYSNFTISTSSVLIILRRGLRKSPYITEGVSDGQQWTIFWYRFPHYSIIVIAYFPMTISLYSISGSVYSRLKVLYLSISCLKIKKKSTHLWSGMQMFKKKRLFMQDMTDFESGMPASYSPGYGHCQYTCFRF